MDLNNRVTTNGLKAWILASRPKTLTGAVSPVLVGAALVPWPFSIQLFALCLLFAVVMQIDANFVNDYYDYRKGADREDRLGPERACAQGWVTPWAMLIAIALTTLLACVVGLLILVNAGHPELLIVGGLCVAGCFLYTTHLSYMGWGDIMVIIFFGIVPVGFTYYVLTDGQWTLPVTLAGLGMGVATDTLLIINNYRDIDADRISGKRTLAVRFGRDATLKAYVMCGIVASILANAAMLVTAWELIDAEVSNYAAWDGLATLLPLIYTFIHTRVCLKMVHLTGSELNSVLGLTAASIFLYGVLLTIGMAIILN